LHQSGRQGCAVATCEACCTDAQLILHRTPPTSRVRGMTIGMRILPVDAHCSRLSEAVIDVLSWYDVAEWLHLAAAIDGVQVNTAKHDHPMMCDDHGYGEARDVLLRKYIEELTVFSLIWGGLEALLDKLSVPNHPEKSKRGKISNACHYLRENFTSRQLCTGLTAHVEDFRRTAQSCFGLDRVQRRFVSGAEYGRAGIGLHTVYGLRNQFAHGSAVFPEPDGDNRPISPHKDLLKHASRIVLLQMQMLLIAHLQHSEDEDEYYWLGTYEPVGLSTGLAGLHLEEDS
jgi:hypothetical protein